MVASGFTRPFKLEITLSFLEDTCQVSICLEHRPETCLFPCMGLGLKFWGFLNNNQMWCFNKQELRRGLQWSSVQWEGNDRPNQIPQMRISLGGLCAFFSNSSIKLVFYTNCCLPAVRKKIDT